MMRLLIRITVFILFACPITHAQVVQATLEGEPRDVLEMCLGFNRRSDAGTWWTDESFIQRVAEINPDIVRYPGGTQANYWDWRTGQFIPGTDKDWGNKQVVTIPTLIHALPDRTKIVYVINMARPTPSTGVDVNASEEVLKSESTLELKIQDMLEAIEKFITEGKKPYAIELGNELYFGNIESGIYQIVEDNGVFYSGWDKTNNRPYASSSKRDATEISALFYLRQAKEVVKQIRAAYPDIKFALTTSKSGNGNSARDRWNNTVFEQLGTNTEFALLKNEIHAVTQHHYLNDKYGIQNPIGDAESSKAAIAEGIRYPVETQADYDMVPEHYKIWYTEYGEVKGIAEETWADAVRYAALTYSWLARGEKVDQLDFHHLTDNTVIRVGSPMRLAPVGIAAKLFMSAAAEMSEMQQIHFDINPVSVDGVFSLYGYKFKNDKREALLIMNLSDQDIEQVSLDQLFGYSGERELTQYHSEAPWISGVALGDSNISFNEGPVDSTFPCPKFSITLIEARNELVSLYDVWIQHVTVFPNPVLDFITVQSHAAVKDISIYNMHGSQVLHSGNVQNRYNLSNLNPGIYICIIDTNQGTTIKKLIKR